jgi:hypothetical protein
VGEPYVGIDSEWRPALTMFDKSRPAILQLSGENEAFIVDLISLANSEELDLVLSAIFTHPDTVCIGFDISNDL